MGSPFANSGKGVGSGRSNKIGVSEPWIKEISSPFADEKRKDSDRNNTIAFFIQQRLSPNMTNLNIDISNGIMINQNC